ncbi:response regulator transcription factor [Microbulbifer pacificus]|uniref:response regulator transcription factor n=1 Tax=Microbulbifer pacificus TaxID=407164 RepID=UPI0018F88B70|nr:helix-turn-helix transcriptional regulator [Microbulbifer pacificus]
MQTMMDVPAANGPAHRKVCSEAAPAVPHPAPEPIQFSVRELEILARIAAGATSVEIAEALHISVHTVKNHRKNILRKSGCRNSGQLITRCTALGLV